MLGGEEGVSLYHLLELYYLQILVLYDLIQTLNFLANAAFLEFIRKQGSFLTC